MVILISGKTGTGKTTYAVKHFVLPNYRRGRDIYTNVHLLFYKYRFFSFVERFKHFILRRELKTSNIYLFDTLFDILDVKDACVFFDDAGVLFNAKSWENVPIEFVHKLMLQRHDRIDMIATVPNIRSVHIDYRRLVQKWYHIKLNLAIGRDSWARKIFLWTTISKKDVDQITIVEEDSLAENDTNFLGNPVRPRWSSMWYFTKNLVDTHAKINFKRYKTIWLQSQKNNQTWIIPKEISLKQGIQLFTSLKSQLSRTK